MLRAASVLLVSLALAGCSGGTDEPEVVGVSITAEPNGPSVIASDNGDVPLERVIAVVPEWLPPNPAQVCSSGVRLEVAFDDGHVAAYGPCSLPTGIEPLRMRLVRESARLYGVTMEPGDRHCAQAVIADLYDNGRVDRLYPSRCYSEALAMLPSSEFALPEDIRRARAAASVGRLAG